MLLCEMLFIWYSFFNCIKWFLYIWPCNLSLSSRLFHQVTVDPATWSPTYTRFAALLDNYQPITRMEEESSFSKTTEIDSFLDAIIRTDVCRYLEDFLMRKGNISTDLNVFLKYFYYPFGDRLFYSLQLTTKIKIFDSFGVHWPFW